ncbi:hypothetical protein A2Z53_00770 [Candidatus Giovannonibacteria bacterium RIFCSPHIGHO2_02_42_15]|uniref:Uncharacterized protein n=2 Tax=Candidatus Giovannoniibacteriota TaxID=1752738 RepID=A0A1F5VLN2_9BACT|nr:MAG: hypothetical protein UV11_C0020G0003 [Candidatus Giovannonibacteria bacterium GW2011_GWF2_42_19]OGF64315.1 MAG: hypothetical protein A2Z53_00770 [Candidatus Giovannonibacteria bacterium RIFCSPHIGHO2_02_42_15]
MSTNFYWLGARASAEDISMHIGILFAAGAYCWDCNQTFCMDGEDKVHVNNSEWHDACPKCGGEGGFTSSFCCAQSPEVVSTKCRLRPSELLVADEYGKKSTGKEFLDMLTESCAIQFTDSIGKLFC